MTTRLRPAARALHVCVAAVLLSACTAMPDRPATSTLGCAQDVVARLPSGLKDAEAHCVAAGEVARQCSVLEAVLVSAAKEMRDLVGRGDASWADLRADRAGIRCARGAQDDARLAECCRRSVATGPDLRRRPDSIPIRVPAANGTLP